MEMTVRSSGDQSAGGKPVFHRREGFLRRALRLPLRDLLLGLEAMCLLAVARLLLVILPFARVMRVLGLKPTEAEAQNQLAPQDAAGHRPGSVRYDDETLLRIGVALRRASRAAPFRAVCLQQAVAASLMLRRRRRRSEIHFGVARDPDGAMSAHAWTCSSGQVMTGMSGMRRHIPVAIFTA